MFSDVIPYPKILFAPLQDQERLWPFHSFWDPRIWKRGKKKSQTRVQIIYSIFYSVMFLKQRQNTYNYISWTLFGDNIKNLNLRPSKNIN